MLNVFLCHASQDKESVRALYEKLIEDGLNPWLDEKSILPGQNWNLEIGNAIRNAHAIIVCLSNNSVNKVGYIQKEIKLALDIADEQPDGAVFLIPVRLEECSVPERLSHLQYADLFKDGYKKIFQVLQIRASKLGITIKKQEPNTNSYWYQYVHRDEEERLNLLEEKFNSAFDRLFLNGKRKFKLKSPNWLNVYLIGAPRVGKTTIIYTLSYQERNPLSKISEIRASEAINIEEKTYFKDLNVSRDDEKSVSKVLLYADFVFYVISPDYPLTNLDRETIKSIKQKEVPYIVLVNKIDRLEVFSLNDYSSIIEDETESICIYYSALNPAFLKLLQNFLWKVREQFVDI